VNSGIDVEGLDESKSEQKQVWDGRGGRCSKDEQCMAMAFSVANSDAVEEYSSGLGIRNQAVLGSEDVCKRRLGRYY